MSQSAYSFKKKDVLIAYVQNGGGDGGDELTRCLIWANGYTFVLYDDGQLIWRNSTGIYESQLREQEIASLLDQIRQFGFFDIDFGGIEGQPSDPIYSFSDPDSVEFGPFFSNLVVQGERVSMGDSTQVIDPLRFTLDYLTTYQPETSTPYHPDSLVIIAGLMNEDLEYLREFHKEYRTDPIPWPEELPALADIFETILSSEDAVSRALLLFDKLPGGRLFLYKDEVYAVAACPILP